MRHTTYIPYTMYYTSCVCSHLYFPKLSILCLILLYLFFWMWVQLKLFNQLPLIPLIRRNLLQSLLEKLFSGHFFCCCDLQFCNPQKISWVFFSCTHLHFTVLVDFTLVSSTKIEIILYVFSKDFIECFFVILTVLFVM